jgi:hypothetical protein
MMSAMAVFGGTCVADLLDLIFLGRAELVLVRKALGSVRHRSKTFLTNISAIRTKDVMQGGLGRDHWQRRRLGFSPLLYLPARDS